MYKTSFLSYCITEKRGELERFRSALLVKQCDGLKFQVLQKIKDKDVGKGNNKKKNRK